MARFIKLHQYGDHSEILVNLEHVSRFRSSYCNGMDFSHIFFASDNDYIVVEEDTDKFLDACLKCEYQDKDVVINL